MIQALFDKMATSQNLRRLDLVEVLDWTMEEAGKNNRMVKQNFQPEHTPISPSDGSENLSTTINFSEISKLSKLSFAPDLVIEIAKTSLLDDLGTKRCLATSRFASTLYEELGIAEYWVVDVQNQDLRIDRNLNM
ncbi:Uma2 family endonuclease [Nostoc sp. XA013]|nr:Uma2 family endonuclease [Nostoc sp. XA013]